MNKKSTYIRAGLISIISILSLGMLTQSAFALEVYTLDDRLDVTPSDLQNKNSYEIAELMGHLMQPRGEQAYFPWDTMANSDIIWTPEGIRYQDGTAYRNGIARVNILGEVSTVLKGQVEELAWSLTFVTNSNPGFGATHVVLEAGGSGDNICFGVGNTMCSFDIEKSLKESGFDYTKGKMCAPNSQKFLDMYTVHQEEHQEMHVVLETNAGSGGASTRMLMLMDESLVNTNEEPCRY